ncbi:MAG: autotransporter domain-containing protein [Rhodoferax sp.]
MRNSVGKLLFVIFSLLIYGHASAACNLGFSTVVGGQVTKSGSEYKYTFSATDYANCDPGGQTDGMGSSLGIYVDAIGNQNSAGNKTFPSSSAHGTNNVYIMSIGGSIGPTNIDAFYYTPPGGYSGSDSFVFYDFNGTPNTVNVTVVPTTTAPDAPTIGTATAGNAQATVTFTAPASNGGSAITGYTVTSTPGSFTGTSTGSTATPITVTGLTNGTSYTFKVTATNAIGTSAASAASNGVIPKAPQTITFTNPGGQNFGTTPTLSATATASSGLTPTFTSTTTGVCTITSGGVLTFVTAGSCTINADQVGNAAFSAATTVPQTFTVAALVPGAPSSPIGTAGDTQVSVAFTAPSSNGGSAVTGYTVTASPGGATAAGATSPLVVTGLTNGASYTFTVTATNSAGTGSASTASASVTPKAPQTITFTNPGAQNFGTTPTLTATSTSALTPTFSSTTTGVCTITSGGTLTFVTAGSCTINADQAGNTAYLAATTVAQTFTVNAIAPSAPSSPVGTAGDGQVSVAFTAPLSSGGTTITNYTVTASPGGATGSGAASPLVVTGLTNGTAYTFTVTATNSAGTGPASIASVAVTPKAAQTITFNPPGGQNFGTTPTLTATASSGLTPTFTSITTGVCTITSGGALTFVTAGTCTINADQAGNGAYLPATTVGRTFNVNPVVPGTPTSPVGATGNGQVSVAFTAPASNGGSAIIDYTVTSSPGGFTATGATSPLVVTGLTNGTAYTFTVTARNTAGSGSASAASLAVTPKAPQTITFTNPGPQNFSTPPTLTATASSGLTPTFTSTTTGVCTITSGGVLTFVMAGTCTINADQAGNTTYLAATTVTQSFTVAPLVGVLTFATPGSASATMGSTFTNVATSTLTGGSYGAISYSSSNTAVATVNASGVITPVSAGTSTITATQAAVVGVNAQATQSYLLTVGKNTQVTLNVTSDKAAMTKVTGTATLSTTGGSGTGAVSYAVTTGSCSIAGSVISAGSVVETCVVTATKATDTNYSAATATVSIQVLNLATSTVTLASSSLTPMVGQSVNLTATLAPASATGTASFKDGATVIANVNISGGVASFSTTALAVGSHNLTVVYSGDAGTAGSTSSVLVVGVNVRPDPVNNPVVTQNIAYQASTTQRFSSAQMSNIYNHVQMLRSDFNVRNRFGLGLTAPYLDALRVVGAKILDNASSPADKDVLSAGEGASKATESQRRSRASFAQGGVAYQNEERLSEDGEADEEPVTGGDASRIAGMPAGFWTAGNIDVGSLDALDGSLTKFTSKGLTFGMDVKVNSKLIVGASLGYAKDNATFDNLGSESRAEQWSGSVYLSYKPAKQWFIDGAFGAGRVIYDNHRWDSTNSVLLSGDRKGKILYGSLSLTRELNLQQFRVHPFGRIDVLNVKLDGYSEQGSVMALTYKDSSFTNANFTGGLDISKDYALANGQLTPSLKLQLSSRASGDVVQSMYYTDMGANGPSYNSIVTGIPDDIRSLGLGLNFRNRRGFQANVAWLGSMGANDYRANSVRVDLRFGF